MLFRATVERHRARGRSYKEAGVACFVGAGHARDAFPCNGRKASRPRALLQRSGGRMLCRSVPCPRCFSVQRSKGIAPEGAPTKKRGRMLCRSGPRPRCFSVECRQASRPRALLQRSGGRMLCRSGPCPRCFSVQRSKGIAPEGAPTGQGARGGLRQPICSSMCSAPETLYSPGASTNKCLTTPSSAYRAKRLARMPMP